MIGFLANPQDKPAATMNQGRDTMKPIPVIAAIAAFVGFVMFADFDPDNEMASFGATVIGCGLAFAAYRLFGGD